MTVPFKVSTPMEEPATSLSSKKRDFTKVVMPASSM
jgi:hypothetical protein